MEGVLSYKQYIASKAWKEKRAERLEFDSYTCVVCKDKATDVHHLTYDRLGSEDIRHDLVSACPRCHRLLDNLERCERYNRRQHKINTIPTVKQKREDISHGLENGDLQINIIGSADYAQRTNCRPAELVFKED